MKSAIRSYAMAVGAAAFLSAQAAAAAPIQAPAGIDPLVALSVFGTSQSQAAVCATAGSAAAAAAATTTTAQGQARCVLPVTGAPPAAVAPPPALLAPAAAPKAVGTLPMLLGLAAIVAALVAIASGGGKGGGDLTPVSPA